MKFCQKNLWSGEIWLNDISFAHLMLDLIFLVTHFGTSLWLVLFSVQLSHTYCCWDHCMRCSNSGHVFLLHHNIVVNESGRISHCEFCVSEFWLYLQWRFFTFCSVVNPPDTETSFKIFRCEQCQFYVYNCYLTFCFATIVKSVGKRTLPYMHLIHTSNPCLFNSNSFCPRGFNCCAIVFTICRLLLDETQQYNAFLGQLSYTALFRLFLNRSAIIAALPKTHHTLPNTFLLLLSLSSSMVWRLAVSQDRNTASGDLLPSYKTPPSRNDTHRKESYDNQMEGFNKNQHLFTAQLLNQLQP